MQPQRFAGVYARYAVFQLVSHTLAHNTLRACKPRRICHVNICHAESSGIPWHMSSTSNMADTVQTTWQLQHN